jgi:hypothetical protein
MFGYLVSLLMGLVVGMAHGVALRPRRSSHWSAYWA